MIGYVSFCRDDFTDSKARSQLTQICAEVKRRVDNNKEKKFEKINDTSTESTVTTQQVTTVTKTRKSISFTSRLDFAAHDLNRTEISLLLNKHDYDEDDDDDDVHVNYNFN